MRPREANSTVKLTGYSDEPVYYVYIHCKADSGEPFYVGKGKGRRMNSSQGRNQHWKWVCAKHGFHSHVVEDGLCERSAYHAEAAIIETLKPRFHLCNYTDGGKGMSGYRHSEKARRSMSEKRTGRKMSDAARAKMSETIRSRPDLLEIRRSRFNGDTNPAKQDLNRQTSSARMKATNPMADPNSLQKSINSRKGMTVPLERRRRVSEKLTGRKRGPFSAEHAEKCRQARILQRKAVRTTCGLEFESALSAAKTLGISQGSISNVCTGRAKSAGGLVWYFADNEPQEKESV